ncbi:hypothetical protein Gotur_001491 [Gossypium turneri]
MVKLVTCLYKNSIEMLYIEIALNSSYIFI